MEASINAMQDYQIINFVKPKTEVESELINRLSSKVEALNYMKELQQFADETEQELADISKFYAALKERNVHLENFFDTVVQHMSNTNGVWPCAEPWDEHLIQAVLETMDGVSA